MIVLSKKNGSKKYNNKAINGLIQSLVQEEARLSRAFVDFLAIIGFSVSQVALHSTLA